MSESARYAGAFCEWTDKNEIVSKDLHRRLADISKKIELAANLGILLVSCLLAVVLVKGYFLSESSEEVTPAPTVSSLDIDWNQHVQTLILVLSRNCRFCTESAPFYRRLSQSKGNTHLVALLPQSVEEGREYLVNQGVLVDEVKHSSLEKIGVSGTPTLVLVDTSGVVKNFWLGKLSPEQEAIVLSLLAKV